MASFLGDTTLNDAVGNGMLRDALQEAERIKKGSTRNGGLEWCRMCLLFCFNGYKHIDWVVQILAYMRGSWATIGQKYRRIWTVERYFTAKMQDSAFKTKKKT